MARAARWIKNRKALHELDMQLAEGMEGWAEAVLDITHPPDAPPIGVGLVERGGTISYVDGKKVGGTDGVKKPRALRVRGKGIAVGVGYTFPARFNEMGTVHQPARPFFAPALIKVVGDRGVIEGAMVAALQGELRSHGAKILRTFRKAQRA